MAGALIYEVDARYETINVYVGSFCRNAHLFRAREFLRHFVVDLDEVVQSLVMDIGCRDRYEPIAVDYLYADAMDHTRGCLSRASPSGDSNHAHCDCHSTNYQSSSLHSKSLRRAHMSADAVRTWWKRVHAGASSLC